jgi:hypothetical protein
MHLKTSENKRSPGGTARTTLNQNGELVSTCSAAKQTP